MGTHTAFILASKLSVRNWGVISAIQAPDGQSYSVALKEKTILSVLPVNFTKGLDKTDTPDSHSHQRTHSTSWRRK